LGEEMKMVLSNWHFFKIQNKGDPMATVKNHPENDAGE